MSSILRPGFDFAFSQLTNAPGTSGLSLILKAGTGARFPDPAAINPESSAAYGSYPIYLRPNTTEPSLSTNTEKCLVTAKVADTLTVTRAYEGSTLVNATADYQVFYGPSSGNTGWEFQGKMSIGYGALPAASTVLIAAKNNVSYVAVDMYYTALGTGTDSGTIRASATQAIGTAAIRAMELHTNRFATAGQSVTWGLELGIHSEIAGNGTTLNVGLRVSASHAGWTPTGVRQDTGLLLLGEDGWTHGIRYLDTDSVTVLFDVGQTGKIIAAGTGHTFSGYGAGVLKTDGSGVITANASLSAADIANRTRTFFIPAGANWVVVEGAPTAAPFGSAGAAALAMMAGIDFDPATQEQITTTVYVPADFVSAAVTCKLMWSPSNTNTGNVYWAVLISTVALSEQIDQGIDHNLQASQPAADGVIDNMHEWTAGTFTPTSNFLRVTIARIAANGLDTFTGDARFHGLLFSYTADM